MDQRAGSGEADAGSQHGLRPIGDTLLLARFRLPRRLALRLGDERFLAHGRNRVRYRQIAARAHHGQRRGRQHTDVPQPVGARWDEDPQERPS